MILRLYKRAGTTETVKDTNMGRDHKEMGKTTKDLPIMSPATSSLGIEDVGGFIGVSLKQKKQ